MSRVGHFVEIERRLFRVKSRLLNDNDKNVASALLYEFFVTEHSTILITLERLQYLTGKSHNIGRNVERLIARGLFLLIEKDWGIAYTLSYPDDFIERLRNISPNFEDNRHSPWYCPKCGRKVVPKIKRQVHQVIVCSQCETVLREEDFEQEFYKGKVTRNERL